MTDSERVIKGLECCREMQNPPGWRVGGCDDCPYHNVNGCVKTLQEDAINLLKAQEPRVMTLEEAVTPMWFEKSGDESGWITGIDCSSIQASTIGQVDGDDWYNLPITDYGRLWRCWTSRPTDAQRKAVEWNG